MITPINNGYFMKNDDLFLHINFYKDNIVRFTYSKTIDLRNSSYALIRSPVKIDSKHTNNTITTNSFKIKIHKKTLKVSICDKLGNIISSDKDIYTNQNKIIKSISWEKGFYGMGEKYGHINLKGTKTSNWNTDVLGKYGIHNSAIKEYHTSIPFYIGLDKDKCYGVYFDNTYKTFFDFGKNKEDELTFSAEGGDIDYYFIYDNNIQKVIEGYCFLTGTNTLPRKDFLGYHQSRYSYSNKDELMYVAKKMRKEKIPCDVLYLDIDYMKDYKVFTIDSEKFCEFRDMMISLKKMNYKLTVIIDPGIKVEENYHVYKQGKEQEFFIKDSLGEVYIGKVWGGDSVFPDFLRENVRKWWGELHKEFIDLGIEGIWNDMNEPADFSTKSKTIPIDTVHLDDKDDKKTHDEIHNIYGLLQSMATYEGIRNINPDKRSFILTRAAFAGSQRYSALWTGDNASTWENLQYSIPMYLNLGISGYSFIGSDVGGFLEDSNGELLTRWTQLGVFTPLFRNHSDKGTVNQEPWCFGEKYKNIIKKYIELRYKLVTYIYNLMKESSNTGKPVIRPLFYHYQNDENTYNINDQFLFGENILVCPVISPKTKKRMVYLPKGEWYCFWTKRKIKGKRYITVDTPLDIIPIYIKSGSIIPMNRVCQYIKKDYQILDIHFYLGTNNSYNLYLDDGLSFKYKKGIYSQIEFKIRQEKDRVIIKSKVLKNKYPIPKFNVHIHGLRNNKSSKFSLDKKEFSIILKTR
ncbi:alpha-glucosidase 2 [Gottschalkia purinilytica]|uniref:Alpha-glucosidase 2 n=1 Tax=Gottschalkia purinilytica TaxID=1503 RepID=A0A0L0WDK8_GOTPU|nr:TIM-barrel domain-containing protein [Gottschalkia purinilytica]KNF09526.1 alpha-glucosidase 2 [Gottschalkia purinilytica]